MKGVKYYSESATGFTIEKTEVISGSSTVNTTSDTVEWIAIGPMV